MTCSTATVAQLRVYPFKSLDPVQVEQVAILASGALAGDRTYALVDATGQFVNGKRNARIHALRSQFDGATQTLVLRLQDSTIIETFDLTADRDRLTDWLTQYFGFPVSLQHNFDMGFPDDTESPGATLVSTATLEAIAQWYPGLSLEDIRLRFRANIEITGVPAFWEDRLFAAPGQAVRFQVGAVQFRGVNPCQRCVVVTRDPYTGTVTPEFQKTFVAKRQALLPEWAARSPFNHFFRLAVNTRVPASEIGKVIRVGDRVILDNAAQNAANTIDCSKA